MKNILFFFPHNLMEDNAGCIKRARLLINYFKENKLNVDLVYSTDFWDGPQTAKQYNELKKWGQFRQIFKISPKPDKKNIVDYLFKYKFKHNFSIKEKHAIPDLVTSHSQHLFNEILKTNTYDYIIISYAYWANFVKDNKYVGSARLIIDTHDFLTSQEQNNDKITISAAFSSEIERLNLFHEVWVVSSDEQYLFSQFCRNEVKLVPIAFESNYQLITDEKNYDLIYIASDNPHNIRSIQWFFEKVFSKLDPSVTLCIIGSIGKHVGEYANVRKFKFVEDLSSYYKRSKLAICPMLSGTGVKVKVLEALSFGLPVISSPRGVDGLINKTDNGCVVSNSSGDFAKNINSVLNNTSKYNDLRAQCNHFFKKNYSLKAFQYIMKEVFEVDSPILYTKPIHESKSSA